MFRAPVTVIGTTGTPARAASRKPPDLKGPSLPVRLRVPSGAITKDRPFFMAVTAASRLARAAFGLERSTGVKPAAWNAQPRMGTRKASFLISVPLAFGSR